MKFTLSIELPNQKTLAYVIELNKEDWSKFGFDPCNPQPPPTLDDPSTQAEWRASMKRWRQVSRQRLKRVTSLNQLMQKFHKQALKIIEMQDKETQ